MADQYPVVTVEPAWVLDHEGMGTKRKFWYREPDTGIKWLFKYPREGTGEHWAEKVAAEVAGALGVDHATAELAVFDGRRGVAVRSFVPDHWDLVHGNQLMEVAVDSYDPGAGFRYKRHTLSNIWECLHLVSLVTSIDLRATRRVFAEYLLLDAIIGNTDRHHENWGIAGSSTGATGVVRLAPSFDHGSSLGRELDDRRRGIHLNEGRVGAYIDRGRGAVYWTEDESRAPSPLELFRRAAVEEPETFQPAVDRLEPLGVERAREVVDRVPEGWMSPLARDFACRLMETSIEELRRIDS